MKGTIRVLKENPLAQLILHRVATLPVCHVALPRISPTGCSRVPSSVGVSGKFPDIIPPMPRKVRTAVSPRPYQLRSLTLPRVLFPDTDDLSSDSDGMLFPECSTPSSSGSCSYSNGTFPDSEPDVSSTDYTVTTRRVTHSLTRRGAWSSSKDWPGFLNDLFSCAWTIFCFEINDILILNHSHLHYFYTCFNF